MAINTVLLQGYLQPRIAIHGVASGSGLMGISIIKHASWRNIFFLVLIPCPSRRPYAQSLKLGQRKISFGWTEQEEDR
jgi:hypothetical protein